jgi:ribosome-associated heat shock protein Hsp15
MPDETRIDRWLCAVRLVKTRPMATQLCDGGHVRVNGNPAKPSTKVRAGDVVHALIADRERIVEVVRPIENRVGAPEAATCYVDNSPPRSPRDRTRHQGRPWGGPAEQAPTPRARTDAAGRPGLKASRSGSWPADRDSRASYAAGDPMWALSETADRSFLDREPAPRRRAATRFVVFS